MMKFSKTLLTVLGVVLVLGTVGLAIYNWVQIFGLEQAAQRFGTTQRNPNYLVLIALAAAFLGGLLLGVAMAMPSKTFKARYAEMQKNERIEAAQSAGFSGASTLPKDNFRNHDDEPEPPAQSH